MPKEKLQVKLWIDVNIMVAFKAQCALEDASMSSVVQGWMGRHQVKDIRTSIKTMPQRKKAVADIIGLLSDILENQEQYRDSIPEQFAQRYEIADNFCDKLEEAIGCLEDVF